MKIAIGVISIILLSTVSWSQSGVNGKAQTKGVCSPATTGNNNSVVIHCDVDTKQGAQIVTLLNQILINQRQDQRDAKLDAILKFVEAGAKLPRRLDGVTTDQLVAILRASPSKVRILTMMNDKESYDFAYDWYQVFDRAGWDIDEHRLWTVMTIPPATGIEVSYGGEQPKTNADLPPSVFAIGNAIVQAQVQTPTLGANPSLARTPIMFTVGSHP